MKKEHQLKKVSETKSDKDQPHRILNEMGFPEETEFTTDDSDGMVTIRINLIKNDEY